MGTDHCNDKQCQPRSGTAECTGYILFAIHQTAFRHTSGIEMDKCQDKYGKELWLITIIFMMLFIVTINLLCLGLSGCHRGISSHKWA